MNSSNKIFIGVGQRLPTDLIMYISSYLSILERLVEIPPNFKEKLISCISEYRNPHTQLLDSFGKYYDDISNEIRLKSWKKKSHTKYKVEYYNNNSLFATRIRILNEDIERFMSIEIMFHSENTLAFNRKSRKALLSKTIKKCQEEGFGVEMCFTTEGFHFFKNINTLFGAEDIPICNMKNCINRLLDIHDEIYNIW